jgi:molybdopterin converting factor small subunit
MLFGTHIPRQEVVLMYFGRPSDQLLMTSERMSIAEQGCQLEQVLQQLRLRGAQWACELHERHVICTVNGQVVQPAFRLAAGDEVGIFSSKPWLAA